MRNIILMLLMLPLCAACGGGSNKPDAGAKARHEAYAEFKRLQKERDKMQLLAPCVYYRVLREGNGPVAASDSSLVTVHYEGRLKDGRVFDSSYDRGEPWTVKAGETIEGWKDVLRAMPQGSKWFVLVYYDKAYGDQSVAGVPAFSNLYFTMELLDVEF